MKIGIDFHVDTGIYQGTKIYLNNLVSALASIDRNNEYLLFNAHYGDTLLSRQSPNFIKQKISNKSGKYNLIFGFGREAQKNKLDLFHTNYIRPVYMRCKTIVTVHDILQEVMPQFFPKHHRLLLKALVPLLLRYTDTILTVSNYTKDLLMDLYNLAPERIFVTHEAAAPCFRCIEDDEQSKKVLNKYRIKGEYVLYVGRIAPIKNIPNMLKAFAQAKNKIDKSLKFVLVGQRDPIFEETQLKHVLQWSNLSQSVIFLSMVPTYDLVYIYNHARALIFISYGEGFGLPILEAMSCGVPVITSNTTACNEIAGNAAVKVNPDDLEAATNALIDFIEDEEKRKKYQTNGLKRAAEFSWDRCAKETLWAYEKTVCDHLK